MYTSHPIHFLVSQKLHIIMFIYQILQPKVALPALHITLGVFFRLFELLEEACHHLDLQMANMQQTTTFRAPFEKYSTTLKALNDIKAKIQHLEGKAKTVDQLASYLSLTLTKPEQDARVQLAFQEAAKYRQRIRELVSSQMNAIHIIYRL